MSTTTRPFGVLLASVGCAAALALSTSAAALAANQALMLTGIDAGDLSATVMASVLGGAFGAGAGYQDTNVHWPAQAGPVTGLNDLTLSQSVAEGTASLNAALTQALTRIGPGEHVTIVGLSAGSLVADAELQQLLASPNPPAASQLNFVVVADANRSTFNANRHDAILNYTYTPPPASKYATTVVGDQYDGFGDFPDRWWNVLAVANAIAGVIVEHVASVYTDLSTVPASDITVTVNSLGGVTTRYFIAPAHIPLVVLFPFLQPYEAALKKIIDAGYSRNDNATSVATPAAATAASAASPTLNAPAETVHLVKAAEPAGNPAAVTASAALTNRASAGPAAVGHTPNSAVAPTTGAPGSKQSGVPPRSSVRTAKAAAPAPSTKRPSA